MLLMANDFLYHATHAVANNGIADFFACGHAKPKRLGNSLLGPIDDKLAISEGFAFPINTTEILPIS